MSKTKSGKASKKAKKTGNSKSNKIVSKDFTEQDTDTTESETVQAWQRDKHIKCTPNETE